MTARSASFDVAAISLSGLCVIHCLALPLVSADDARCPMVDFVNLISGKWAIPILYRLIVENRPVRFGELQRATAPITQKELTRHLRTFEQQGLVRRTVYPEMPPRVEYEVSDLGRTLKPTLDSLAAWMLSHGNAITRTAAEADK